VHDLALWLPLHVIADMVGVPEAGLGSGVEWTEKTLRIRCERDSRGAGSGHDGHVHVRRRQCAEREKNPGDDIMSVLLHAEVDGGGSRGSRSRCSSCSCRTPEVRRPGT